MLRNHYKKIGQQVPQAILNRFITHDIRGNFKDFDDPLSRRAEMGNQTQENPQQEECPIELKVFTEPEVTYQITLFKQKMQKNKESALMQ